MIKQYRVVDIFAGPGGLSEGFSAFRSAERIFDVKLSVEKDDDAAETLLLRTFFREFASPPEQYYQFLRGEIRITELYAQYRAEHFSAVQKVWKAALGPGDSDSVPTEQVRRRVSESLENEVNWILIGGPPCQAYSLIGRARNKGNRSYDPDADVRQRLYVEYLQILADHAPAVFVMENVKGLLSANVRDEFLFERILNDLRTPVEAMRREGRSVLVPKAVPEYIIYSLTTGNEVSPTKLGDCIVRAENHGIPQCRHRVILLGVRKDIAPARIPKLKLSTTPVGIEQVIDDLPRLRSGLSKETDGEAQWLEALRSQLQASWTQRDYEGFMGIVGSTVREAVRANLRDIGRGAASRGGPFLKSKSTVAYAPTWFNDVQIGGVTHHHTRSHIRQDLCRYMLAASFAQVVRASPHLDEFPPELLPAHKSARSTNKKKPFKDRFKVQVRGYPSATVVSHISKDGHYYIHPDPLQCRSLTVREAARLQTFPDNYYFLGGRTAQYTQVGNAVPPLLALQIAEIVYEVLSNITESQRRLKKFVWDAHALSVKA